MKSKRSRSIPHQDLRDQVVNIEQAMRTAVAKLRASAATSPTGFIRKRDAELARAEQLEAFAVDIKLTLDLDDVEVP